MKLGTETVSLHNYLMAGSVQPAPAVGMGATMCGWTDRHAGTIVRVTACQIHVQQDKATRTDQYGMSEAQSYRYEPDPQGKIRIFRKRKTGWRSTDCLSLAIGVRAEYYDYSF